MRIGLAGFAVQCVVIGTASDASMIWASIGLALLSNLVYPSLSSLVSRSTTAEQQGQAQGSINGVKALTEGFGPLLFGLLMNVFENTAVPGFPYIIGGGVCCVAIYMTYRIPEEEE